ncbi:heterokaryon incompatibility protein-domain-containing protein [Echria macrotheca]|uniref:Heterokaryon incompatibility protein-domain-containing protein n=1 Tax=Echria macrotheca TaxID=438768 RepID=A0AAJ0B4M3_9PEZI|nr:heterokaryon incompatibility protein-domain-containing protein [Echria macrotheca]
MWLINVHNYNLKEFLNENDLPRYAILSHTWGDREVTFAELKSGTVTKGRGWEKIKETCRLARSERINWAWVDTCCIDKDSSANLTESLNSMFRWYQKSTVCYVWLEDLEPATPFHIGIARSRWVTRGWTLQELIAPRDMVFFDAEWGFRGDKRDKCVELSAATGIPEELLRMESRISDYTVAQRMSWAAKRVMTRVEDTAYCLLGLFEVSMPLIYGEGTMAFHRLQEEIMRRDNDMTLFAWNPLKDQPTNGRHCSLLAISPAAFLGCGNIKKWPLSVYNPDFSVTNKGLRTTGYLALGQGLQKDESRPERLDYSMRVGRIPRGSQGDEQKFMIVSIVLWKAGPDLYLREREELLISSDEFDGVKDTVRSTIYIVTKMQPPDLGVLAEIRQGATRLIVPGSILRRPVPESYWSYSDLLFFEQSNGLEDVHLAFVHVNVSPVVLPFVVVFVVGQGGRRRSYIFEADQDKRSTRKLFSLPRANLHVEFSEFADAYPDLPLKDRVRINVDHIDYVVSVGFRQVLHLVFPDHPVTMHELRVRVERSRRLSDGGASVYQSEGEDR